MEHLGSTTIPLLPAVSFDGSVAFWQALGFELVLRQKAPNAYAVVRYERRPHHRSAPTSGWRGLIRPSDER